MSARQAGSLSYASFRAVQYVCDPLPHVGQRQLVVICPDDLETINPASGHHLGIAAFGVRNVKFTRMRKGRGLFEFIARVSARLDVGRAIERFAALAASSSKLKEAALAGNSSL